MDIREALFKELSLNEFKTLVSASIDDEINSLPSEVILGNSEETLFERIRDKYRVRVPTLLGDAEVVDVQHDVPVKITDDEDSQYANDGTQFTVEVPFDGHAYLFKVSPDREPSGTVTASVFSGPDRLVKAYTFRSFTGETLKTSVSSDIRQINDQLELLRADMVAFNTEIEAQIRARVATRRQYYVGTQSALLSSGLKVRRRKDAPTTYVAPVVRRPTAITTRTQDGRNLAPAEPTLAFSEYEHIISVMKNMVLVMERSPHAFKAMEEEDIRTHFLVQLNAQYEGQATGETFNYDGKTDILIRVDGRNVFIAECKFWTGPEGLRETIDQLLGYLSWRDTKTAVVMFNRNKGFTRMVEKLREAARVHPNCRRLDTTIDETAERYVFSSLNDPDREVYVTIMAFDVPKD